MPRPPCDHSDFQAQVNVGRLSNETGGPIAVYTADVTISCAQCGVPFRFVGLTAGSHYAEPRVSIDGIEMRAPIEPAEHEVLAPKASYTIPAAPMSAPTMPKLYDITSDEIREVSQFDINRLAATAQAYGQLVVMLGTELKFASDGQDETLETRLSIIRAKLTSIRERLAQKILLADCDLPGE